MERKVELRKKGKHKEGRKQIYKSRSRKVKEKKRLRRIGSKGRK